MKVLHIGLHKTGSTFLQREIFPRLSGVNYYGDGSISAAWAKEVKPVTKSVPLWSSEAALGWPYPNPSPPQISRLMALCADLGVTHLLAFKRDYPSWVRSLYFQTLNEGGRESFPDWYNRNKNGFEDWRRLFLDLEIACREHDLVLEVMSWSELRCNVSSTVKAVADFLGCQDCEGEFFLEQSNCSVYGEYAIGTYIVLNRIVRGRVLRRASQFLRISPRQLIQNGRLGFLLNRMSPRQIQIPNDLMMLEWLDKA